MTTPPTSELLHLIGDASQSQRYLALTEHSLASSTPELNEFCLFLKPEVTELNSKGLETVLEVLFERIEAFAVSFVNAAAIPGSYIMRHRIAEAHYGVINTISRLGTKALSESVLESLLNKNPILKEAGGQLLGGHEFLAKYPFFTPESLAVFYDNLPNQKLAPGTHCVTATVRGVPTIIFNGFHPEQLAYYARPEASLLAFVFQTSTPWRSIRQDLTGATNPSKAALTSIRGTLLLNKDEIGLAEVSSARNCVHVSAGPLEGMVEVRRYFSDFDTNRLLAFKSTLFGDLLTRSGVPMETIEFLAGNPILPVDEGISAFDFTEEVDAPEALERILSVLRIDRQMVGQQPTSYRD